MKKILNSKKLNKILIGLLVVLGACFLYYATLFQGNSIIQLSQTQAELDNLQAEFELLSTECGEVSERYNQLSEGVDEEIETTIEMIEEYQQEMAQSLAWFSENQEWEDLDSEFYSRSFEHVCTTKIDTGYEIDLNCIVSYNDCYENLIYISDTNEELISVEQFFDQGGGDCEDYAMFFKAEYNYLKNVCLENEAETIILTAWQFTEDYWEQIYLPFCTDDYYQYYIASAIEVELPQDYIYPNVVCGLLLDPNTEEVGGHCMNSFTKEIIESPNDVIEFLDKSPLVEPQTGQYLGLINDESSGIYILDENENYESYINMVITDYDHYLYSEEYSQWMSYGYFYDELEESKEFLLDPMVN
ncbi:hypothetical protein HOD38_05770 [archaeon]|nr:hypothetical protein [archaeon]MBT4397745.1 hypothetical protein [archaeon]MBT4441234.1 hypothetical protein [archaeon]